jgi:tRNA(Ile2) C34 agmatinyltransferase TiaS
MSFLKRVEGFVSKKLGAGAAGTAAAVALESEAAMWISIAYIIAQAAVDCVGAWRD